MEKKYDLGIVNTEKNVDREVGKAVVVTKKQKQLKDHVLMKEVKKIGKKGEESPVYKLTAQDLIKVLKAAQGRHIVVDLDEDHEKVVVALDHDVEEFLFPKEIATAKITHEVGQSNTVIVVAPGEIDAGNSYHLYLEIEGEGAHYGADVTIFAYNGATCLSPFSILVDGQVETGFASIDSTGQINLDVPMVMTPESQATHIYIKRVV